MYSDLEASLLVGLIRDPSKLNNISIHADDFESEPNSQIFKAIENLVTEKSPVDLISISDYLDENTSRKNWLTLIGGMMHATNGCPDSAKYYAGKIREHSIEKKTKAIAQKLINNPKKTDEVIRELMELGMSGKSYEHTVGESAIAAVDEIERTSNGEVFGVSTGLTEFDKKIGSYHNSDLIIIGARPAMGKTALLLNQADRCGVAAGIISAEQDYTQLGQRMIAINGSISAHRMRLGKINDNDWSKITSVVGDLNNRKIWINDKPSPHIYDIIRQARKWKYQYDIKILYVDYLQKIRGIGESRQNQVSSTAGLLRDLARELKIPVVALAQLNRKLEERTNKRPIMSDLKESGEIEQEADLIFMLYRDEVYNPDTKEPGIAEIIICKNRHGPIGYIKTMWSEEFMRFDDYSEQWPLRGVAQ